MNDAEIGISTLNRISDMKETVLVLAALVFLVLMIGRTEMSLHPFYFRMEGWMSVVGYILIALGFVFLQVDSYQQGYKKALDDALEMIENKAKEDKQ